MTELETKLTEENLALKAKLKTARASTKTQRQKAKRFSAEIDTILNIVKGTNYRLHQSICETMWG